MRRFFLRILWLLSCLGAVTAGAAAQDLPEYMPGHILVQFAPNTSAIGKMQALRVLRSARSHALGGLPFEEVSVPTGVDPADAAVALRAQPGVLWADVDHIVPAAAVPNDPLASKEWHITNIYAPTAWDVTTGKGMVIAIVDTGCDPTQPDLMAHYLPGYNCVNFNTDTSDVAGHGTAVAGTAAAIVNNGIGLTGIAGNASILPVRVGWLQNGQPVSSTSTVARGIQWAFAHGAKIINCSFEKLVGDYFIARAAQQAHDSGAMVVVSAGNSASDLRYAANTNLIVVGATDQTNKQASFSNFGVALTVVAPGVNIWTTQKGGTYGAWMGTSFSSPIVAGALALAWASAPTLTVDDLRQVLITNADDLGTPGFDTIYGYGKVNAARLVQAARGMAILKAGMLGQKIQRTPLPIPQHHSR